MCFDNNNHRNVIIFGSTKYSASKANDACLIIQPDVLSSRCLKMILMFLYSANLHVCNNFKLFIAAYTTEKMRV